MVERTETSDPEWSLPAGAGAITHIGGSFSGIGGVERASLDKVWQCMHGFNKRSHHSARAFLTSDELFTFDEEEDEDVDGRKNGCFLLDPETALPPFFSFLLLLASDRVKHLSMWPVMAASLPTSTRWQMAGAKRQSRSAVSDLRDHSRQVCSRKAAAGGDGEVFVLGFFARVELGPEPSGAERLRLTVSSDSVSLPDSPNPASSALRAL